MKIRVESSEAGDWSRLYLNDELFAQGHSLSKSDWLALLQRLGHTTEHVELPAEAFE